MINQKTKAKAMVMLRQSVPVESVAASLEIPLPLVKEWHNNLESRDLEIIEANIYGINKALDGEILPNIQKELENKIQQCAVKVVNEAIKAVTAGDIIYSKSIESVAKTLVLIHETFVRKTGDGNNDPNKPSLLQSIMRD